MVSLTPKQVEYLPAVKWLIGGPRGSGKTFLIAYALFTHAQQSGEWVVAFDHAPLLPHNHLMKLISQFAEEAGVKIEMIEMRFRVVAKDRA